MHKSINMESSLSKKVPNSIERTEIYSGKNSELLNFSPNKNNIFAELISKNMAEIIIAIKAIFWVFSGCFNLFGINNK